MTGHLPVHLCTFSASRMFQSMSATTPASAFLPYTERSFVYNSCASVVALALTSDLLMGETVSCCFSLLSDDFGSASASLLHAQNRSRAARNKLCFIFFICFMLFSYFAIQLQNYSICPNSYSIILAYTNTFLLLTLLMTD